MQQRELTWRPEARELNMRTPRIHVPEVTISGEVLTVSGQAAHHVTQVLRLRPGSLIRLFNGQGGEWDAVLLACRRSEISLEVRNSVATIAESALSITLVQGIARNDRMDFILQKSVELGVARIQPLWMQRSQARSRRERHEKHTMRWQGIIINACEQCGRTTLPELCCPEDFTTWLERQNSGTHGIMLQPDSTRSLHDIPPPAGDIIVLVGPEGGLSPEEQELAAASGFIGIRMGQRILRTETAALSALAGMQTLWGDFSGPIQAATHCDYDSEPEIA